MFENMCARVFRKFHSINRFITARESNFAHSSGNIAIYRILKWNKFPDFPPWNSKARNSANDLLEIRNIQRLHFGGLKKPYALFLPTRIRSGKFGVKNRWTTRAGKASGKIYFDSGYKWVAFRRWRFASLQNSTMRFSGNFPRDLRAFL